MSQYKEDVPKNQKDMSNGLQVAAHDDEKGWKDGWVSPPPPVGRRILKFYDDTQVGVIGLDEIMIELYTEGRKPNEEAAEEIIKRLEARNNYIASSERARKEYSYVLLNEYRAYVKERSSSRR